MAAVSPLVSCSKKSQSVSSNLPTGDWRLIVASSAASGAQTAVKPLGRAAANQSGAASYILNFLGLDGTTGILPFPPSLLTNGVDAIYPTPKYLLIVPTWSTTMAAGDLSCTVVALKYADGSYVCIPDLRIGVGYIPTNSFYNPVLWDATGDQIVFQGSLYSKNSTGYTTLMRMDFTAGATPTVSELYPNTSTAGYVEQFGVDSLGNAFFRAAPTGAGAHRILQLTTSQNQTQDFGNGDYADCLTTGTGAVRDNFYYTWGPGGGGNKIYQVTRSGSTYTSSVYFDDSADTLGIRYCNSLFKNSTRAYVAMLGTGEPRPQFPQIIEILNPSLVPRKIPMPGTNRILQIVGNDDMLALRAEGAQTGYLLLRYTIATDKVETLIPANQYRIDDVSVATDGTITFGGLRLSDSKSIVGEIALGSTSVNVLTTSLPDALKIVRLR